MAQSAGGYGSRLAAGTRRAARAAVEKIHDRMPLGTVRRHQGRRASGRAGGGLVLGSAPSGSLRSGAYLFRRGDGYTHGGLSPQECVVPDLTFSSATEGKQIAVAIEHVQWFGLRCRAVIKPAVEGMFADLRSKPNDSKTSVTQAKAFDAEGKAGLLVEDENLAGTSTSLVVFDATGRILCKRPTIIGGEA